MGCLGNLGSGNSIQWILILMLVMDDGCMSCDSLIWILLLSRFCGDSCDNSCGCSNCGYQQRNCGC